TALRCSSKATPHRSGLPGWWSRTASLFATSRCAGRRWSASITINWRGPPDEECCEMLAYMTAEFMKLKRSLALLLCVSAPIFVRVSGVLIGLHSHKPMPLDRYAMTGAAFWAFAMLPMTVTALSVLIAQMEHGPRTWDHLLALPGARPWLFLAKAIVMLALVAAMSLWLFGLLVAGAEF